MTTQEERLLLTELNRVCNEAPAFALAFPENNLPLWDEFKFGFRILDIGYGILSHARERQQNLSGLGDATTALKPQLRRNVIEPDEPNCSEH